MALSDRLDSTPPKRPSGLPCSVAVLEARLEGDELTAFQAMLYTLGWSGEQVHTVLRKEGYEVGKQTINRHRAQSCRCFL